MTTDTTQITNATEQPAARYIPANALITTTHGVIEAEVHAAYIAGYLASLCDVAERTADLDASWRQVGRIRREERIARDLDAMERYAERFHAKYGTRPWPGVAQTTSPPHRRRQPDEGCVPAQPGQEHIHE